MRVKSPQLSALSLLLLTLTVLGGLGQKSEVSWTISKSSVCGPSEEESGCLCQSNDNNNNEPHTYITCTCGEETQMVHLRGSRRTIETEHVTWRIQNCPNVTIHPNILPRLEGVNFNLILANISSLELLDGAFESDSTSGSPLDKSLTFDSVSIQTIPPRAFPSNLARIQFQNSVIGTIKPGAFKQLYITSMIFHNSTIYDIQPKAFYQDLTSWVASNSHFNRLQSNCITGGIRQMNWTDSVIQHMESNSLTALIGHSLFQGMTFGTVEPHGLTINQWSSLSFINNTFGWVNVSAIDLTQRSPEARPALLQDNTWHDPEPNFITVGSTDEVIVLVENNTFMDLCECGKTFSPLVTTEGSKQWFVKALLRASRCPISPRATSCLSLNESYLQFDQLDLLCEHYACVKDLESTGERYIPQSFRLRLIAILLGILAGAIVLSLLITMCVYLVRRPSKSKRPHHQLPPHHHNHHHHHPDKTFGPPDFSSNVVFKIPHPTLAPPPSTLRPRSTLFEDVEMEDKGVQTMPSELSTDVLEGLREKLSKPDSFWDAKETIDHLYGLIQVQSTGAGGGNGAGGNNGNGNQLSSPPDVTMCNNGTCSTSTSTGLRGIVKSASTIPILGNAYSVNPLPLQPAPAGRYAQIRSKPKTAAMLTTLCEYRDPSDSAVHIYSELDHPALRNNPLKNTRPVPPRIALPVLCEYNEPKDVQTHVYAELTTNCANQAELFDRAPQQNHAPMRTFSTLQRPLPDIPSSSSVPILKNVQQ